MFHLDGRRIWVAGHTGMVGSALVRRLQATGAVVVTADRSVVDLTRQRQVDQFVGDTHLDGIVIAAAKVGGILANSTEPVDFLHDNLLIQTNILAAANAADVQRVLVLGSSCIYPREAAQPIAESALLTGALEPTNQWYALAKIAGIRLAQAYRGQYGRDYVAAMPCNLYGPGDNFDLSSSHVLPALLRKAHEAKRRGDDTLTIWGSGRPRREFLHVDDCADALVGVLERYSDAEPINVGSGSDISIGKLADMVCSVVGFYGDIVCDPSKPDGMPQKLMSNNKISALGWAPRIGLREGIEATYRWYLHQRAAVPA